MAKTTEGKRSNVCSTDQRAVIRNYKERFIHHVLQSEAHFNILAFEY